MYIVDFATKVSRIKWFSSSYSAKGVSFKFQIDAWYSNPKSTESNDFHRLAVQKVFPSNFQIDAWYSNPKCTESNDFHRLAVQKVFPSNFQIDAWYSNPVYWIKWFSSSCRAKGVPSNFRIAMAFCFLPICVTFSSFSFNERLS